MSVAKVVEILAEGSTIEAAIADAVSEASKTIKNIRSVYVQDIQAMVKDQAVTRYRVNCKISFQVGD